MEGTERAELVEPYSQGLLPQHVKRALAFMRGNMAERITLAELTSACGVSERTLLKQFQRFLGLPPLGYLRRLRLNAARRELTTAGNNEPIAEIAARCGFTHLGRFASEYRRQFNETPSASRQRVRAPIGSRANSSVPQPCRKPSLLILPLRTETLRESLEARDLSERLAAMLSRMHVASVRLAHRSYCPAVSTPQPRNAGTEYCLLGRLVQRDERLRVIVRLIDVAADRHLWGDCFDGSVNDPFELQDRVVDGVLCSVVSHITDAEIERACDKDPNALAVHDLVVQALPLILSANVPSARKAISILTRALELDPADALPTALLACCQAQLGNYYGTASPAAARADAMQLAQRAGVLSDADPLVTVARAATAALSLQSPEADALATRALAMDPTSTWAWERRGLARLRSGSDPDCAIADFTRALKLRGPSLSRGNCFVGIAGAHAAAGRLDHALLWQRKAMAENPSGTWMHIMDSCYALKAGDWSRVVTGVECMRRAQPEFSVSLIMATFPPADPVWLDAVARASMPLT
jgi:AraC-like DNA-binding protein